MFRLALLIVFSLSVSAEEQLLKPTGRPSTMLPAGVERVDNIVYARYARRVLWLDLFKPKAAGTYPAVLVVHGGGWQN